MSKGMQRRSFLVGLLAVLLAPWLARRAPAATRHPVPPPTAPPACGLTTYTYDWRPLSLTTRDDPGNLVTTSVYDCAGRLVSVQGKNTRYSWEQGG